MVLATAGIVLREISLLESPFNGAFVFTRVVMLVYVIQVIAPLFLLTLIVFLVLVMSAVAENKENDKKFVNDELLVNEEINKLTTRIGKQQLALIGSLIFSFALSFFLFISHQVYQNSQERFEVWINQHYQIQIDEGTSDLFNCHQGLLHYQERQGSSVLQYKEFVECSQEDFDAKKESVGLSDKFEINVMVMFLTAFSWFFVVWSYMLLKVNTHPRLEHLKAIKKHGQIITMKKESYEVFRDSLEKPLEENEKLRRVLNSEPVWEK